MSNANVKPATGKLGVMVVGLGAVSSTFITGVLMARKGLAKPVGSMTQYDKIRVGQGEDKKYLQYKDIVPLADLNDIVFAAWDVYPANAFESAMNAEVLKEKDILPVKDELEKNRAPQSRFRPQLRRSPRRRQRKDRERPLGHDRTNPRRHPQLQERSRRRPRRRSLGRIH